MYTLSDTLHPLRMRGAVSEQKGEEMEEELDSNTLVETGSISLPSSSPANKQRKKKSHAKRYKDNYKITQTPTRQQPKYFDRRLKNKNYLYYFQGTFTVCIVPLCAFESVCLQCILYFLYRILGK
jgi:hypothetical protein